MMEYQNNTLELTMIDQEMRNEIDLMEENRFLKEKVDKLEQRLSNYRVEIEDFRKSYSQNRIEEILRENRRLNVNLFIHIKYFKSFSLIQDRKKIHKQRNNPIQSQTEEI